MVRSFPTNAGSLAHAPRCISPHSAMGIETKPVEQSAGFLRSGIDDQVLTRIASTTYGMPNTFRMVRSCFQQLWNACVTHSGPALLQERTVMSVCTPLSTIPPQLATSLGASRQPPPLSLAPHFTASA
jgi:hypothetical protein